MIPLLFFLKRDATMGWRSAALWGLASGIGFGVSEGVMYAGDSYNGLSGGDIYLVRFISCVALHAMWAAMAAIAVARNLDWYESVEDLGGFVVFGYPRPGRPDGPPRLLRHAPEDGHEPRGAGRRAGLLRLAGHRDRAGARRDPPPPAQRGRSGGTRRSARIVTDDSARGLRRRVGSGSGSLGGPPASRSVRRPENANFRRFF